MDEHFPPSQGHLHAASRTAENELDLLLRSYPELDGLEPYYIEWEFIWPM